MLLPIRLVLPRVLQFPSLLLSRCVWTAWDRRRACGITGLYIAPDIETGLHFFHPQ